MKHILLLTLVLDLNPVGQALLEESDFLLQPRFGEDLFVHLAEAKDDVPDKLESLFAVSLEDRQVR